jgi:hypothetical protein
MKDMEIFVTLAQVDKILIYYFCEWKREIRKGYKKYMDYIFKSRWLLYVPHALTLNTMYFVGRVYLQAVCNSEAKWWLS